MIEKMDPPSVYHKYWARSNLVLPRSGQLTISPVDMLGPYSGLFKKCLVSLVYGGSNLGAFDGHETAGGLGDFRTTLEHMTQSVEHIRQSSEHIG